MSYFDTTAEKNREYYAILKSALCEEYDFDYIMVPLVLSIQTDGKIGGFHMGTVDDHHATNEKMTAEQAAELKRIYIAVIQGWKETLI